MDVEDRPIDIFSFIITYSQTFNIACLKQMPSNGFNKPKLLYDTIEVRALAHVCKLDHSSLRNARVFWVKKNMSNSFCNLRTITTPLAFEISNNPMVTCLTS